jgi:hypothetical protein
VNKQLPPPNVPEETEAERFSNGVKMVLAVPPNTVAKEKKRIAQRCDGETEKPGFSGRVDGRCLYSAILARAFSGAIDRPRNPIPAPSPPVIDFDLSPPFLPYVRSGELASK